MAGTRSERAHEIFWIIVSQSVRCFQLSAQPSDQELSENELECMIGSTSMEATAMILGWKDNQTEYVGLFSMSCADIRGESAEWFSKCASARLKASLTPALSRACQNVNEELAKQ
ncbi:hypothetical protein DPX16_10080 [Anabarilius grahami]|uniref:Uncharacterized protein n=1 Tax=Anabarilius grahami TaxID=495550 RepID=A0A3N0XYS3_ANAGA|nr:hypothetical protein DPX16_10080 [Anabarilius grahami]